MAVVRGAHSDTDNAYTRAIDISISERNYADTDNAGTYHYDNGSGADDHFVTTQPVVWRAA